MVTVLSTLLVVLAAPPSAADVQRSVDRVLDSRYQRGLPGEPAAPRANDPTARPVRWAPPLRRRSDAEEDDRSASPSFLSTAATYLMWILTAVVAVVFGVFLANELSRFIGPDVRREGSDGHPARAVPDVVARPLEDAEQLAARGEFGDAIRALLLRTLGELTRRLREPIPPSLTSREVLSRIALTDDARAALAGLVAAVELTHFGNDVPTRGDYDACMAHFRSFAVAYMEGDQG